MTNKDRYLKERYASLIPNKKLLVIKKNISNHMKKPIMHYAPFIAKYSCYAYNQIGHLKYDGQFKYKGLKCIWGS